MLNLLWQIISDGVNLVIFVFNQFIEFLNYYLTTSINTIDLNKYFIGPVQNIMETLDEIIVYVFVIMKFSFVLSTLAKKNINIPIVSKYVNKVINYINVTDYNESSNNNQQPQNSNGQMFNNNFVNQQGNNIQYPNNNQQFINNANYQSNPTQINNNIN